MCLGPWGIKVSIWLPRNFRQLGHGQNNINECVIVHNTEDGKVGLNVNEFAIMNLNAVRLALQSEIFFLIKFICRS